MVVSDHQQKQQSIINQINDQIQVGKLRFTTVSPTENYQTDKRICLTGVHFPHSNLIDRANTIISIVKKIEPHHYYYPKDSLHMTIKNVRVVNDPPHFDADDVKKARSVFSHVIPRHRQFQVFFSQLLLFPHSLALVGTTEPELDQIIFDLDKELHKNKISDDKTYVNTRHFFANMTLVRFYKKPTFRLKHAIQGLSDTIKFPPYTVDSVSLLTTNAVLRKKHLLGTWRLSTN